jgi:hypothetical protein
MEQVSHVKYPTKNEKEVAIHKQTNGYKKHIVWIAYQKVPI